MGRILAIDFGTKRTGLAVTDPQQIIATALETVETSRLLAYLEAYFQKEAVELLVIGMPKRLDNSDSDMAPHVRNLAESLKTKFPDKPQTFVDERFTSSLAKDAMIRAGSTRRDRRDKANIDKVSATIILQSYMEMRK
ncbi:MAG: Holliday junction resolvase RuvX [Bacteroidetes bacterium]|nr:Holliday junction resolvase RuvX [Bacteroidota bacterium]